MSGPIQGRKAYNSELTESTPYTPVDLRQQSIPGNYEQFSGYFSPNMLPTNPQLMMDALPSLQSDWDKVGNIFAQTAGEAAGAIIAGAGSTAELFGALNWIPEAEGEFGNVVENLGADVREGSKDLFPIYSKSGFVKALPALGSTIGLMAVSLASGGLASGGLARAGALSRVGRLTASNISRLRRISALRGIARSKGMTGLSSAIFSRHAEGMMEAHGAFEAIKQELMSKGITEKEASKIAEDEAWGVYKDNWWMLATDILQYLTLTKGLGNLTKSISKNAVFNKSAGVLSNMTTEAFFEEGYQHIITEEAILHAKDQAGLIDLEGDWQSRFAEYLGEPDMINAMAIGALGGGVFSAIGPTIAKKAHRLGLSVDQRARLDKYEKNKKVFNEQMGSFFNNLRKRVSEAEKTGSVEAVMSAKTDLNMAQTMKAISIDKYEEHLDALNSIAEMSEEELQAHNEQSEDKLTQQDIDFAKKLVADSQTLKEYYDDFSKDNDSNYANFLAVNKFATERYKTALKSVQNKVTNFNEKNFLGQLSTEGQRLFHAKLSISYLSQRLKSLENNKNIPEDKQAEVEKLKDNLKTKIKEQEAFLKDYNDSRDSSTKKSDNAILSGNDSAQRMGELVYMEQVLKARLSQAAEEHALVSSKEYQKSNDILRMNKLINSAKTLDELDAIKIDPTNPDAARYQKQKEKRKQELITEQLDNAKSEEERKAIGHKLAFREVEQQNREKLSRIAEIEQELADLNKEYTPEKAPPVEETEEEVKARQQRNFKAKNEFILKQRDKRKALEKEKAILNYQVGVQHQKLFKQLSRDSKISDPHVAYLTQMQIDAEQMSESELSELYKLIDQQKKYAVSMLVGAENKSDLIAFIKFKNAHLRILEDEIVRKSLSEVSENNNEFDFRTSVTKEEVEEALSDIVQDVSEDGRVFTIRGETFFIMEDDTESSIKRKGGNVEYVTLYNERGVRFKFTGNLADEIAYNIILHKALKIESAKSIPTRIDEKTVNKKVQEYSEGTDLENELREWLALIDEYRAEIHALKLELVAIGATKSEANKLIKAEEIYQDYQDALAIKNKLSRKVKRLGNKKPIVAKTPLNEQTTIRTEAALEDSTETQREKPQRKKTPTGEAVQPEQLKESEESQEAEDTTQEPEEATEESIEGEPLRFDDTPLEQLLNDNPVDNYGLTRLFSLAYYSIHGLTRPDAFNLRPNSDIPISRFAYELNQWAHSTFGKGALELTQDQLMENESYRRMKALTDFLESGNIVGTEVLFEINHQLREDRGIPLENLTREQIGRLPVRVTFMKDGEPIKVGDEIVSGYLHDIDWDNLSESVKEEQINKVISEKTKILNGQTKGTISVQTVGIENTQYDENFRPILSNVHEALGTDLTLGRASASHELQISPGVKLPMVHFIGEQAKGHIFAVTKGVNGQDVAVRLYSAHLNENEANLLVYLAKSQLTENAIKRIKNHEDPRISGLAKVYDLNNMTGRELFEKIVFTSSRKTAVVGIKKDTIIYRGEDFNLLNDEHVELLIKKLTSSNGPLRNIDLEILNTKNYQNYVIETGLLKTDFPIDQPNFYHPRIEFSINEEDTSEQPIEENPLDVLASKVDTTNYTPINLEEELAWAKKNIPNVPIEIVERLIKLKGDVLAYGTYQANLITLARTAKAGTIYHEAFHAVTDLYLTENEKTEVYGEAERMAGKKLTPKEADEFLARKFEKFMLGEQVEFAKPVLNWFQKLLNFILFWKSSPSRAEALFNRINSGYYNYRSMSMGTSEVSPSVATFTQSELTDIGNSLTFVVSMFTLQDGKLVRNADFDIENFQQINIKEIIKKVAEDQALRAKQGTAHSIWIDVLEDVKLEDTGFGKSNVIQEVRDTLSIYGIELNEDDVLVEEDERSGGLNIKESYLISNKDTASANTKLLLAFTPKIKEYINGKPVPVKSNLGLNQFEDFNKIWNTVEKSLNGVVSTDNQLDVYPVMLDKLRQLGKLQPSIRLLVDRLENKTDAQKTQFVAAFSKIDQLHYTTYINGSTGNYQVRVGTSDVQNPARVLRDVWEENFDIEFKNEKNEYNTEKINKVVEDYEAFKSKVAAARIKYITSPQPHPELYEELSKLLERVGIMVDTDVIKYYAESKNEYPAVGLFKSLVEDGGIDYIFISGENSLKQTPKPKFFRDERVVLSLGDATATMNEQLNENTVLGPKGNKYWNYSLYGYSQKLISEIKLNPEVLDKFLSTEYGANSVWANYLNASEYVGGAQETIRAKRIKEFAAINLMNFVEENSGDRGTSISRMPSTDEYAMRINSILQGIFPYLNASDKSRMMAFRGLPIQDSDNAIDILAGYLADEINTMSIAWSEIQDKENLIEGYHHKNGVFFKEGQPVGDAFKSLVFPQMSEIREELFFSDGRPKYTTKQQLLNNSRVVEYLTKKFNNAIQFETAAAIEHGAIKISGNQLVSNTIDKSVIDINKAMADFTINSIVSFVESTKLFIGQPQFYKILGNFKKRTAAPIATGTPLRIYEKEGQWEVRPEYTVGVISDKEYQSPNYKDIKDSLEKVTSKEQAAEIAKFYTEVNTADGQGYITPYRWREIMKGLGLWKDSWNNDFEALVSGKSIPNSEFVLQSLKGVHFELVKRGGHNVPTYLKYSQAVLFPALVKGTPLQEVYDTMIEKGIDELVYESGVKAGAITIHDNLSEIQPFYLSNKHWKLQQDLPYKGMKQTLVGSQIKKNILLNSKNPERNRQIHEAESRVSAIELNRFLQQIDDGNNVDKLYEILLESYDKNQITSNILRALKDRIPFEAIPQLRVKIQNKLASLFNNSVIKTKANGGSFIQISGEGIIQKGDVNESDVIWFKKEFNPPKVREKNGRKIVTPSQVLLPYSVIKNIPGYQTMSKEEIAKRISPEMLKGVAYRIPNQNFSSNEPIEVVGILPPYMGDVVMAYTEITKKTGSDFDIDKLYVILPEYHMENGTLTRVPYITDRQRAAHKMFHSKDIKAFLYENKDLFPDYTELINDIEDFNESFTEVSKNLKKLSNLYTKKLTDEERFQVIQEISPELTIKEELKQEYKEFSEQLINRISAVMEILPMDKWQTVDAIKNKRLDLYYEALTDPENYAQLIKSIDAEFLKKDANTLAEMYMKSEDAQDLLAFTTAAQFSDKQQFHVGKASVGITANHLVDHPLSQEVGLKLAEDLGIGNGNLSSITTEDGEYLISDVLSAFLNAFVDIAKDNYVSKINANTKTANVYYLLIRSGVNPHWITRFMTQPVIRRFTEIENSRTGRTAVDKAPTFVQLQEEFDPKNERKATYFENLTQKQLESMLKGHNPQNQKHILAMFEKFYEKAEALSASVLASKADTVGVGKNLMEALIIKGNVQKVSTHSKETALINFEDKFKNSMLEQYMKAVDTFDSIMSKFFFSGTQAYRDRFNNIINQLGYSLDTKLLGVNRNINEKTASTIMNEMYAYMLSNAQYEVSGSIEDLFTDKNGKSVASHVHDYKYNPNSPIKDNLLIQFLTFKTIGDYKFVGLSRSREIPTTIKNRLIESWLELFYHDNPKINEFAERLVKYAYQSSGFKMGLHAIFDIIPMDYLLNKARKYGQVPAFITQIKNDLEYYQNNSGEVLQSFDEQFYKNNYKNSRFVPKVSESRARRVNNFNKEFIISVSKTNSIVRGYNSTGEPLFVPFVKMWSKSKGEFDLYKFVTTRGTGDNIRAEYVRTNKLGFSAEGYTIKEYAFDQQLNSQIPTNNVKLPNDVLSYVEQFDDIYEEAVPENKDVIGSLGFNQEDTNFYEGNIKPEPNTVFVFGSNPEGRHSGGNAKVARNQFNAKYGQPAGLQGDAYGVITKDLMGYGRFDKSQLKEDESGELYYTADGAKFYRDRVEYLGVTYNKINDGTATTGTVEEQTWLHKLPASFITEKIKEFYETVKSYPEKKFKVAYNKPVDQRSLNGYTGAEMIEMFNQAGPIPNNVIFSEEWYSSGLLRSAPQTTQEETQEIQELFESNPELANAVYSKILTNSGISAENLLSLLLKDNLIEKQCS